MFHLSKYLNRQRDLIEHAIDNYLPPEITPPAPLHKAIRYSVIPGGKRIRPILCLAASDAISPNNTMSPLPGALASAIAIELLHNYTLIHDDLPSMDNDVLRRGKPTVHVAYGEAMAVLAGDALQTLAFECLAKTESGSPCLWNRLILELCHAAGSQGVIAGQVEDISALETLPSKKTIRFVHQHKTGSLFIAAMKMGGIAAEASVKQLNLLYRYGCFFGEAFQITDDLLDAPEINPGTHKKTMNCLAVYDRKSATMRIEKLLHSAVNVIQSFEEKGRIPLTAIAQDLMTRTI